MKILRGGGGNPKILDTRKGGYENIVGLGGRGSENLYASKPTHGIIIQIEWFSTQQFNGLCNSAVSRSLLSDVASVIITLLFIPKMLYKISKIRNALTFYNKTTLIQQDFKIC